MTARRAQHSGRSRRALADLTLAPGGDMFRLEGEYWTIVYQGALCRLRDAKGLHYLAHLLRHPGERVECGDLVSAADQPRSNTTSSAERARLAVTKRIKAAVTKIAEHHAALGNHLIASVKTGYQCAYLPDPHDPISWQV